MLRHAVAAALAKKRSVQSASASRRIETITMNGFSIVDPDDNAWELPEQRRFTVVTPSGSLHEVLVEIDEAVVDYVQRLARRRLPFESSFWTEEARRLLANYLWTKGEVPRTRTLRLNRIEREAILAAERWND